MTNETFLKGQKVTFQFYGKTETATVLRTSADGKIVFLDNGRWMHSESCERATTVHTSTPWEKYKTQDGKYHIDIPGDGVIDILGANAEENAEFVFRACNEFNARGIAMQAMTAKAERLECVNADLIATLAACGKVLQRNGLDHGAHVEDALNMIRASLAKANQ